jgi:CO/xanthine dehydrogenase Mo-binding subunit
VVDIGDPEKAFSQAAHVASATYFSPYQAHAVFGPNCAIADVRADRAMVISSTQDVYASRKMLARLLGMKVERVRVQYCEGSGTFGHSCYEDAPQAAAIMAQEVGRPVRVQFMRWDELGWDNYGLAQLAELRAAIDADGKIIAYTYDGWQHGWHVTETSTELAHADAAEGAHRRLVFYHRQPHEHRINVPRAQQARGQPRYPDARHAQRLAATFAPGHGSVVRLGADHR